MLPAQILRHTHNIALFDFQRRAALDMAIIPGTLGAGAFLHASGRHFAGSAEGRVSDLGLDENGKCMGTFDGNVFGGHANWRDEDLLNVAAVETLLRGAPSTRCLAN